MTVMLVFSCRALAPFGKGVGVGVIGAYCNQFGKRRERKSNQVCLLWV
jgi:hypothetical protein